MAYPRTLRRTYGAKRAYRRTYRKYARATTRRKYSTRKRTYVRRYKKVGRPSGYGKKTAGVPRVSKTMRSVMKGVAENVLLYSDASSVVSTRQNLCALALWSLAHTPDLMAVLAQLVSNPETTNSARQWNIVLRSATIVASLSNHAAIGVTVKVWDVVAKRDITVNSKFSDPLAAWQFGIEDTTTGGQVGTGVDGGVNHPGSDPRHSTAFTTNFAITRTRTFKLAPGKQKDITMSGMNLPYMLHSDTDTQANQGMRGVRGISRYMLFQFRGDIVRDSVAFGGGTKAGYGLVNVGMVENKKYTYSYVSDSIKDLKYVGSAPTTAYTNQFWTNQNTSRSEPQRLTGDADAVAGLDPSILPANVLYTSVWTRTAKPFTNA